MNKDNVDYVKVKGITAIILLFLLHVLTTLYPLQSVKTEFQVFYFLGITALLVFLGYFILMYFIKSTTPELYKKIKNKT